MRFCTICGSHTDKADFYGRSAACKECYRARVRLRRLVNPAVREYDRERAKKPERREKSVRIVRAWRVRNPDAYKAQTAVSNAVRDGRLTKMPCEICGEAKVHAHHKDYSKPLVVVWLCARCHHRLHALFPEFEGANKRREA